MAQTPEHADTAQIARRASSLLQTFFTARPDLKGTVLDRAFSGHAKDPRGLIDTAKPPLGFAVECVNVLLTYGCTDGRCHALGRLLAVIREHFLGAKPHPDYLDLSRLLDEPCGLPTREEELAYLERLLADIKHKAALYSPLRAVARIAPKRVADPLLGAWDDLAPLRHVRFSAPPRSMESQSQSFDDILNAFVRVKRAALLGRPGAGKTTTLRKLAADLATRALADRAAPLPLLVSLGDWTGEESFADFLAGGLPGIGDTLRQLSRAGRLILLLDGLNEMPTSQRAAKSSDVRQQLVAFDPATPVFVSCRADDYQGDLDLRLDTLSLQPLSPRRVRLVLRHWLSRLDSEGGEARADRLFWQLAGDEARVELRMIWQAEDVAPDPRSLLGLAANPFMLTMLFLVWIDQGEVLPRNRGDLFARFVAALLEREHLILPDDPTGRVCYSPDGNRLLAGLAALAWTMQGRRLATGAAASGDQGVLTVVGRDEAIAALGGAGLVKKAQDATLLEGDTELRFRHQLLQEHFTALGMKQRLESGKLAAVELWPAWCWWKRTGWEESAVLLAGIYADDCTPIIRWLKDATPDLAAQCLLESGAHVADRDVLLRELRNAWLPRLTSVAREPAPEGRAHLGRVLARLGLDNRKGVGLANRLPDIDWVDVQGGGFIYQDAEQRTVQAFRIARFPITNAQFQVFLDDPDGYANDRWWEQLDGPDRDFVPRHSAIPNHPRETVSWFEAMAFCTWLGHRLGCLIRLPTEWEWERVARGTDGRVYPWGNEYRAGYGNIYETWVDGGIHSLGQTTPVGIYPQGATPEGVLDLSGNVWEWCLNEYDDPSGALPGGSRWRVLRGGSWYYGRDYARAAYRGGRSPRGRDGFVGFRVLCASVIR